MRSAIEWGIALGLVVGITMIVPSGGPNDFSLVFWPAGRVVEPYAVGMYQEAGIFAYPIWNASVLRFIALFPLRVGLVCVYLLSVVTALMLAPRWGTPAWLVLLSPVFLKGLVYGQPFEAFAFAGLTLVTMGHEEVGLCLLAFKPQIGLVSGLLVLFRKPKAALLPILMVLTATGTDYLFSGRLWIFPWWQMLRSQAAVPWNESLWGGLGVFSLLWIPVGLWLLRAVSGDYRKELWIVTAVGLLCMPYWTSASLWPLVAMVGCWRSKHDSY